MNFLVWKRDGRGPTAQLCEFDPMGSMDWKLHEQTIIQIVRLSPTEQEMTLDQLVALHPCPAYEVG